MRWTGVKRESLQISLCKHQLIQVAGDEPGSPDPWASCSITVLMP